MWTGGARCVAVLCRAASSPRDPPGGAPPYGPTRGCRRAEGAPGRSGDARGAERRTVSRLPPPRPGAPRSQPRDARRPPARLSRPSPPGGGSLPAAARRAPRGSPQDRRDVTQPRAVMRDHPTRPAALIGRSALVLRAGFSLQPSFRGVPPRAAPTAPPCGGRGPFGGSPAWVPVGRSPPVFGGGAERENGAALVPCLPPPALRGLGRCPGPTQRCPRCCGGPCPRPTPGVPRPSAAPREKGTDLGFSAAVLYSGATRSPPSRPVARCGLPGLGYGASSSCGWGCGSSAALRRSGAPRFPPTRGVRCCTAAAEGSEGGVGGSGAGHPQLHLTHGQPR